MTGDESFLMSAFCGLGGIVGGDCVDSRGVKEGGGEVTLGDVAIVFTVEGAALFGMGGAGLGISGACLGTGGACLMSAG